MYWMNRRLFQRDASSLNRSIVLLTLLASACIAGDAQAPAVNAAATHAISEASSTSSHRSTLSSVHIDEAQRAGVMVGLGVEFDPYTEKPDTNRWNEMLRRLAAMHPGFLRVMSGASDYCSGFDKAGAPIFRWQADPEAPELRRVYDVLDFAQHHNIPVYLGEWSAPKALGIHAPNDPRWPAMIAAFVQFLIRDRHYTVIHHYIFMNEPNGDWMWRGSRPDYAAWTMGMRSLRHALDDRGLQDVLLTGPDNSGDRAWFDRSVTNLHDIIGAWEQHIYATDDEVLGGRLEQQLRADSETIANEDPHAADKPRFVAESGLVSGKLEALDQQPRVRNFEYGVRMADYIVQVLRAGWGGADAWDLDDAMHGNGHGGLKIWGFWDSTSAAGMQPRPWYYAWSMLSRTLPPGAAIVPVTITDGTGVRATAVHFQRAHREQWTIVVVNDTATVAAISITLPGALPFHAYHYVAGVQSEDAAGNPAPDGRAMVAGRNITMKIALQSFVVLTTLAPGS